MNLWFCRKTISTLRLLKIHGCSHCQAESFLSSCDKCVASRNFSFQSRDIGGAVVVRSPKGGGKDVDDDDDDRHTPNRCVVLVAGGEVLLAAGHPFNEKHKRR